LTAPSPFPFPVPTFVPPRYRKNLSPELGTSISPLSFFFFSPNPTYFQIFFNASDLTRNRLISIRRLPLSRLAFFLNCSCLHSQKYGHPMPLTDPSFPHPLSPFSGSSPPASFPPRILEDCLHPLISSKKKAWGCFPPPPRMRCLPVHKSAHLPFRDQVSKTEWTTYATPEKDFGSLFRRLFPLLFRRDQV